MLVVSLIWNLIFKLTSVSVEMAILIYSNSITNMLVDMYWGGIPALISAIIAFVNIIYAISNLHSICKTQQSTLKKRVRYFAYAIISLSTFIIHCLTLNYLFKCMIAG